MSLHSPKFWVQFRSTHLDKASPKYVDCSWNSKQIKIIKMFITTFRFFAPPHSSAVCDTQEPICVITIKLYNNNSSFTAPHLVRLRDWSAYKGLWICSFITCTHSHTHTPNPCITRGGLLEWGEKKKSNQYAEEKRWVFSFDLRE